MHRLNGNLNSCLEHNLVKCTVQVWPDAVGSAVADKYLVGPGYATDYDSKTDQVIVLLSKRQ